MDKTGSISTGSDTSVSIPEKDISQNFDEMDKAQEKSRQTANKEAAEILESLDDVSFFSWGQTDPLKVTKGGQETYLRIKIKSLGISEIIEEMAANAPVPPAVMKTHKRDSEVARRLGFRHDTIVWERNEADPTFQKAQRDHEMKVSNMILLKGLAYDLKDEAGHVVLKGKDIHIPTEVIDAEAALRALKRLGFSSDHFTTIVNNINRLTKTQEERDDLES